MKKKNAITLSIEHSVYKISYTHSISNLLSNIYHMKKYNYNQKIFSNKLVILLFTRRNVFFKKSALLLAFLRYLEIISFISVYI